MNYEFLGTCYMVVRRMCAHSFDGQKACLADQVGLDVASEIYVYTVYNTMHKQQIVVLSLNYLLYTTLLGTGTVQAVKPKCI